MRKSYVSAMAALILLVGSFLSISDEAQADYILAWGDNKYGQCDVPEGNDFIAVAAGDEHSVAIRADGSIVAWGRNDKGQCLAPVWNGFVKVAAGGDTNVALHSDGYLFGWGNNLHGLTNVPAGTNYTQVSCMVHGLALTDEGKMVAWGWNIYGALNIPTGGSFVDIGVSNSCSYGVAPDGTITAWGSNEAGLLGIPDRYNCAKVSDGRWFVAAIKSDGSIMAWGDNQHGQCGLVPSGGGFVAVATGMWHGAALREDGSLAGWDGWLYHNETVPGGYDFTAVACGARHSLALTKGGPKVMYVDYGADAGGDGSSWSKAFRYLQDALAAASDGDEVRVAQGLYKPDEGAVVTKGDSTASFRLRRNITLRGGYAGLDSEEPNERDVRRYETVLSGDLNGDDEPGFVNYGDNSYHVVYINHVDKRTVFEGFTVTGGNANDSTGQGYQPNLDGGGIYLIQNPGSVEIVDCHVTDNMAHLVVSNGRSGGGIYALSSHIRLINCTVSGNRVGGSGGGIWVREPSQLDAVKCVISNNSAGDCGGGIATFGPVQVEMSNCVISGNESNNHGGGLNSTIEPSWSVRNCTFWHNTSPRGASISCYSLDSQGAGTVDMRNCILWDANEGIWQNDSSQISITHSAIRGAWAGEGNICEDPMLAEPESGDFRLCPRSACIDAGDPNYVWDGNETDLDGRPRVVGGRVDMGAYEFSMLEAKVCVFPWVLNRQAKGPSYVLAVVYLGEQCSREQVDAEAGLTLYPGAVKSAECAVVERRGGRFKGVTIAGLFPRDGILEVIPENGDVGIEITGHLNSGEYFGGTDLLKIEGGRRRPGWLR